MTCFAQASCERADITSKNSACSVISKPACGTTSTRDRLSDYDHRHEFPVNFQHYTTTAVLLVGAIASGLLVYQSGPEQEDSDTRPRLGIGYYMNEAEVIGTGDEGQTIYRVKAHTASQNLDDGAIDMEAITMIYDPITSIPWDLRANTGRIPPDDNIIELSGNVVAVSRESDEPPTTIRTDYLEIHPDTYVAQTQRDVTIEYAGKRIFATGLRAYFKEDRLQLISNVKGKFNP
jgi:lipopolysaccharide export system protein LptC